MCVWLVMTYLQVTKNMSNASQEGRGYFQSFNLIPMVMKTFATVLRLPIGMAMEARIASEEATSVRF